MADKGKPDYKYINNLTVYDDIITALETELSKMGYNNRGYSFENPKKPNHISHNELNYILRRINNKLFKPNKPLFNNQKSLINYDDIEQLKIIGQCFIDICSMFNKSLGLMSFCFLTGIDYSTVAAWMSPEGEKLNPERSRILKYIKECHKAAQIGLLNESPVGALAVANNDVETGLQWATKQAIAAGQQAVFLIPSERLNRLSISAAEAVPLPVSEEAEKEPKSIVQNDGV
jgi:hypothetical protein